MPTASNIIHTNEDDETQTEQLQSLTDDMIYQHVRVGYTSSDDILTDEGSRADILVDGKTGFETGDNTTHIDSVNAGEHCNAWVIGYDIQTDQEHYYFTLAPLNDVQFGGTRRRFDLQYGGPTLTINHTTSSPVHLDAMTIVEPDVVNWIVEDAGGTYSEQRECIKVNANDVSHLSSVMENEFQFEFDGSGEYTKIHVPLDEADATVYVPDDALSIEARADEDGGILFEVPDRAIIHAEHEVDVPEAVYGQEVMVCNEDQLPMDMPESSSEGPILRTPGSETTIELSEVTQ